MDSLPTEPPGKPKCSHPIFLGPSFPQRAPYFRKTELSWMIFKHHQSSATLTIRSAVYGFLLFCCKRREPPCKSNQEGLLNCLSIALISQYPSAGHQYNWAITNSVVFVDACLSFKSLNDWTCINQPLSSTGAFPQVIMGEIFSNWVPTLCQRLSVPYHTLLIYCFGEWAFSKFPSSGCFLRQLSETPVLVWIHTRQIPRWDSMWKRFWRSSGRQKEASDCQCRREERTEDWVGDVLVCSAVPRAAWPGWCGDLKSVTESLA